MECLQGGFEKFLTLSSLTKQKSFFSFMAHSLAENVLAPPTYNTGENPA